MSSVELIAEANAETAANLTETIVGDAVENVVMIAENTIEEAEERAERAEAVAEVLTEAALEGARGERIAALEDGLSACHESVANLSAQVSELLQTTATLTGALLALTPQPSPPPLLETPTTEIQENLPLETATVIPALESENIPDVPEVLPPKKRRLWM